MGDVDSTLIFKGIFKDTIVRIEGTSQLYHSSSRESRELGVNSDGKADN